MVEADQNAQGETGAPENPFPSWRSDVEWPRLLSLWYHTATLPGELQDLFQRWGSHAALVISLVIVLGLARAGVLQPQYRLPLMPFTGGGSADPPVDASFGDIAMEPTVYEFPLYAAAADGTLYRVQVLHTAESVAAEEKENQREWIVTYEVQPGDTVWSIAKEFGLQPRTIEWANGLELNPDLLRVGQRLIIPPVDGVIHVVEKGETLAEIARRYKVKPEDIVAFKPNGLKSVNDVLPAKKVLVIPGGEKPFVAPVVRAYRGPIPEGAARGTGVFGWPTSGRITSPFGQIVCSRLLGCRPHMGIDIANVPGTPVVAADSGYVVFAGWNSYGYGNTVLIDHGNGFRTLYAHMQVIYVRKGQNVAKGQRIGTIGATGNTTGPHLHFEIRQNGVQRNPLGFLP